MFSLRELIEIAVRIEENGEKYYRRAINKVYKGSVKSAIDWLSEEEVRHREWLKNKKTLIKDKNIEIDFEEVGVNFLKNVIGDQKFSLEEADPSNLKNIEDILKVAIEFENDTIIFFEMLRSLISEDDKEVITGLNEIIEEEYRHVQILKNQMEDEKN